MGKLTSLVPPNMHQLEKKNSHKYKQNPIAVILIDFIDLNVLRFKFNFQSFIIESKIPFKESLLLGHWIQTPCFPLSSGHQVVNIIYFSFSFFIFNYYIIHN